MSSDRFRWTQSKYSRQLFHWIKFPGLAFVYWKVCEGCAEPGAQVSKTSLDNGRYLKCHLRQYRILSTACLTHLSSDPISWLLKNDGSQSDLCFSPALCSQCIDFFLTTSHCSLFSPRNVAPSLLTRPSSFWQWSWLCNTLRWKGRKASLHRFLSLHSRKKP